MGIGGTLALGMVLVVIYDFRLSSTNVKLLRAERDHLERLRRSGPTQHKRFSRIRITYMNDKTYAELGLRSSRVIGIYLEGILGAHEIPLLRHA